MKRFRRTGCATAALGAALLVAAMLVEGFLLEPYRVERRRVTLECPGLAGRPIRALLLSDVDFRKVGRRERAVARAAERFRPDVVLVAGDFLDRRFAADDPRIVRAAGRFLDRISGPGGCFLVPGEEETRVASRLAEAWAGWTPEILVNERRELRSDDACLDLFGADPSRDASPWWVEQGGAFPALASGHRHRNFAVVYDGPGASSWADVEITLAFRMLDAQTFLDFRFAWHEGDGGAPGTGWRILRHSASHDFRLVPSFPGPHHLSGRIRSGFVPPVGTWCRARIRLRDDGNATHIRARFWPAWAPEPARWAVDAVESGPLRRHTGTIALGGHNGRREYADLLVRDADGRTLLRERFDEPARLHGPWRYRSRLTDWLNSRVPGCGKVLLVHNPDLVRDVARVETANPPLVLAGHTHGGQVRVPWLGALHTATLIGLRYDRGMFHYGGVPLFITAGVGTSVVPIRLFSPPEIVLLTLVPPGDGDGVPGSGAR